MIAMIFDVSRPDAPFLRPTIKELRDQYDFEKYDGSCDDLGKAVQSLDDKSGLVVSRQLILPDDFSQRRLKKRGPFRRINRPEKNKAIENCINPADYFSQLFSVPDGISAGYMWWGTAPKKVRAVPLVSLIEGYELQEVVNSAWSREWHGHKACNVRSYEGRGDYAIAVVKVPSRSRADIYDIELSHIPIGERSYGEIWDLFFEHDCADEIWHGYVHFKYVSGVYRFCPHVIAAYLAAGRAEHADFFPYPFPAPDMRTVDFLDKLRRQVIVRDDKKIRPSNKLQQEVMLWKALDSGIIGFGEPHIRAYKPHFVKIYGLGDSCY